MISGKTKIDLDLAAVPQGTEQAINARTSHRNNVLEKYRRLVISMLAAMTALEKGRGGRPQMTPQELNELADRERKELSPLERQVHDSILELEKFRIQLLTGANQATVRALDRILEHQRAHFGRHTEEATGFLQRYRRGGAKRSCPSKKSHR